MIKKQLIFLNDSLDKNLQDTKILWLMILKLGMQVQFPLLAYNFYLFKLNLYLSLQNESRTRKVNEIFIDLQNKMKKKMYR